MEAGVEVAGAFSNYERITFDVEHWEAALADLEKTLLVWTGQLGAKPIKVHLSPDQVVEELHRNPRLKCRYRWWSTGEDSEEWFVRISTSEIEAHSSSLVAHLTRMP